MPVALRTASVGRMTSPVRVVMAEDSPLLRAGLAKLLSAEDAVELLAVAADLDELLAAVEQHRPDVVLSDVRMPPTGTDEGVRAAELLRASHPGIGVLLLSQYDEPSCARRLLEAGASGRGYLLKDRVAEPAQLAAALRTVAEGGSVVDPVVVDGLLRRRDEAQEMTTVQRRVLLELAKGHDERAVASLLGMSPAAVAAEVVGLTGLLGVPRCQEWALLLPCSASFSPYRPSAAGSPPCCSPTSSGAPRSWRRWGTWPTSSCCGSTTRSPASTSCAEAAA
jgi:DNA-binding NarL/FixJ family response regulator